MKNVIVKVYAGLVCPRRSLDCMKIEKYFRMNGCLITDNPGEATHLVIITCGFIDRNIRESIAIIRETQKFGAEILVGGCLEDIARDILEANFNGKTFTTKNIGKIESYFPEFAIKFSDVPDANDLHDYREIDFMIGKRKVISEKVYLDRIRDYLCRKYYTIRIAEGCNCNCTYCSHINAIGKYVSKPVALCVREFEKGYQDGHRMFKITSMDTGYYGLDIQYTLPDLLNEFANIHDDVSFILEDINPVWINKFRIEIMDLVKRKKILAIQSPIQSGCGSILKKMNRWHDIAKCREMFKDIKRTDSEIILSTEVLVGFPGETDSDFSATLDFLKDVSMEFVYAYPYYENKYIKSSGIFPKCDRSVISARMEQTADFLDRNNISYSIMKKAQTDDKADIIDVRLPNGYNVRAIENSRSIIEEIWETGFYDRGFTIKSGMTVIDVGANQGFYSLYAASKGARVISVEPDPLNFRILVENIQMNSLENMISVFNGAIVQKAGSVALYSMDYNEPFASGMVTTTIEYTSILKAYQNRRFNTSEVVGITLGELLYEYKIGHVDVLKIDTEGAELDILRGLPDEMSSRIDKIVMETHGTYKERDICHLIVQKGFRITQFRKLSGMYNTGFIFAENNSAGTLQAEVSPKAILSMPQYAWRGNAILLDGTDSFPMSKPDAELRYKWMIDGEVADEVNPSMSVSFDKTGYHGIELSVRDEYGYADFIRRRIWIFSGSYFIKPPDEKKLAIGGEDRVELMGGTNHYVIDLPDWWGQTTRLLVSAKYLKITSMNIVLEYNGEKFNLDKYFNELKFDVYPLEIVSVMSVKPVLRFSIRSDTAEIIRLKWWIVSVNE